jgi:hypothetical protein
MPWGTRDQISFATVWNEKEEYTCGMVPFNQIGSLHSQSLLFDGLLSQYWLKIWKPMTEATRPSSLPIQELPRISYWRGFVAERPQILNTNYSWKQHANRSFVKQVQDAKATPQEFEYGEFVYLVNQIFLGENKKFAQRWIGPYCNTQVLNLENLEIPNFTKKMSNSLCLPTEKIYRSSQIKIFE